MNSMAGESGARIVGDELRAPNLGERELDGLGGGMRWEDECGGGDGGSGECGRERWGDGCGEGGGVASYIGGGTNEAVFLGPGAAPVSIAACRSDAKRSWKERR